MDSLIPLADLNTLVYSDMRQGSSCACFQRETCSGETKLELSCRFKDGRKLQRLIGGRLRATRSAVGHIS
jgi:hypothetical protein